MFRRVEIRGRKATFGAPVVCLGVLLVGLLSFSTLILAQSTESGSEQETREQKKQKIYPVRNGSVTYSRSEETERKVTPDGTIETERVRMPSWGGDNRVLLEREVRTRKLPDGTVEKEYVLKNPDGANRLVPIEIIREKIKKSGDSTNVEREVLKSDFEGHWNAVRKETTNETGPAAARQSIREVRVPTVTGDWKVVDREITREKSSQGVKEQESVRQIPDADGRLADYEVQQERTVTRGDVETREVTLRRRDFQDTEPRRFYLVERTVSEQTKTADGKVAITSTTESDLLAGGATRNVAASQPQVVEQKSVEELPGQGRRVVKVQERGAADRELRPSYEVIQQTDPQGHVRQVFIPLR